MWRIVEAELRYNTLNFIFFLALVAIVGLVTTYRPATHVLAWMLAFLGVNNWLASRIREKRNLQLVQLPIPAGRIALARLLMILLPAGVFLGLFSLIYQATGPESHINIRVILMLFALVVTIFSIALIFRDTFVGTKALRQGKVILVVLFSAIAMLNLYTFMIARRVAGTDAEPPALIRIIRFVEEHNPSTSNTSTVAFLAIGFVLACLTLLTFKRRKTHIE
jgi:LPXTG-motif cell wall-anchored protein